MCTLRPCAPCASEPAFRGAEPRRLRSAGLVAQTAPCREAHARCAPLVYRVYASPPDALSARTCVCTGRTWRAAFHRRSRTMCTHRTCASCAPEPAFVRAEPDALLMGRNRKARQLSATVRMSCRAFLSAGSNGKLLPYPSKSTSFTSMDSMRSRSSWRE